MSESSIPFSKLNPNSDIIRSTASSVKARKKSKDRCPRGSSKSRSRKSSRSRSSTRRRKSTRSKSRSSSSSSSEDDDAKVVHLGEPIKSPLDGKSYRIIQLANGLKAILISDTCQRKKGQILQDVNCIDSRVAEFNDKIVNIPKKHCCGSTNGDDDDDEEENNVWVNVETKEGQKDCGDYMTGACLSIAVGGFNDPPELPGLAHFCEHMVYFGSEKYPRHNQFDNFITKNGGKADANTRGKQTKYFFQIDEDAFDEAMDMFGNFFIAPLMPIERVLNERNMVHSEFQTRVNDHFKRNLITLTTGEVGHPATNFITGNEISLNKKNKESSESLDEYLYSKVIEFQKTYYKPELMTLAVQAAKSLDYLENLVNDIFGQIPCSNPKLSPTMIKDKYKTLPFNTDAFRKLYKMVPVNDVHWLFVSWELPPEANANYQTKPLNYLARVFNNENPGGLLDYLTKWDLVECLNARVGESVHEASDWSSFFIISCTMTDYGRRNYPKILEAIFSYIKYVQANGVHEWYFREFQEMKALNFHFEEAVDVYNYVVLLATSLANYPTKDVIIGPELITKWDPEVIKLYLNMLVPEKANYLITSKDYESICINEEPILETPFVAEEIPKELITALKDVEIYSHFKPLKPNEFIPSSFCPIEPTGIKEPKIIFENFKTQILHQMCYNFGDKSNFEFKFISPLTSQSGQSTIMTDMWVYFLKSKLHRTIYSGTEAGISSSWIPTFDGFTINLHGFTQKLDLFLSYILKEMIKLKSELDRDIFNTIKHHFIDSYKNTCLDLRSFGSDLKDGIFISKYWLRYELRIQLNCLKYEQFQKFSNDFLQRLFCQTTLVGNINTENAKKLGLTVVEALDFDPLLPQTMPKFRMNRLPLGQTILRIKNMKSNTKPSLITKYFQIGIINDQLELFCLFIERFMIENAFDELRTNQGLGYSVNAHYELINELMGLISLSIIYSSEKFTASFVNARMDEFIQNFYTKFIQHMRQDTFENAMHKVTIDPLNGFNVNNLKQWYVKYFLPCDDDDGDEDEEESQMRSITIQIVGEFEKEPTIKHIEKGKGSENHGRSHKYYQHNSHIQKPILEAEIPLVILTPTEKPKNSKKVNHVSSINGFKDTLERYPLTIPED